MSANAAPRAPVAAIARPALLLASAGVAGLALTLGWQLAIAALFGTSPELDAFWIGAALPKAITDSFHLGLATLLFLVVFQMPRADDVASERDRLASSVFNVILLGTLAIAAVLFATAPWLARAMGPGLAPPLQQRAAATLRLLTLLMIPTCGVGAIAGVLYANGRFAPFALARIAGLALQIALLVVLAPRLGTDALPWAMLAGAAAMLGVSASALRRTGFRYAARIEFRGEEARAVLRMLGSFAILALLERVNQIADRWFASLLGPGAISALEFGWRFEIPVTQIVSISIALPSFALMTLHAASDRRDEVRRTITTCVRLTALLVAPVIVFLVALREPIAALWLARGAFSAADAREVAALIPYLGAVFACAAFGPVLVFAMLTLGQRRILVGLVTLEGVVNIALNGPLSAWLGVRGIVLATALSMGASNALLWTLLLRRLGGFRTDRMRRFATRTLAVCAGIGVCAAALAWAVRNPASGDAILSRICALAAAGVVYLGVYLGLAHAAGLVHVRVESGRLRIAVGDLARDEAE